MAELAHSLAMRTAGQRVCATILSWWVVFLMWIMSEAANLQCSRESVCTVVTKRSMHLLLVNFKFRKNKRMQLVAIVTPNTLHFPFAQKLLRNGFHVVCEKPMTITVEEALELERLVNQHHLTFVLTIPIPATR